MSSPTFTYKPTKATAGHVRADADRLTEAMSDLDARHAAVEGAVLAAHRDRKERDAARDALRAESRAASSAAPTRATRSIR